VVDFGNQLGERCVLSVRDASEVCPEGIFKTDAGLVPPNNDRTFDDRGFHETFPHASDPHARRRLKQASAQNDGIDIFAVERKNVETRCKRQRSRQAGLAGMIAPAT
jgi:hypothetical protein